MLEQINLFYCKEIQAILLNLVIFQVILGKLKVFCESLINNEDTVRYFLWCTFWCTKVHERSWLKLNNLKEV